jgi:FlaA1/EpsC-like NDP-sugar epimerase
MYIFIYRNTYIKKYKHIYIFIYACSEDESRNIVPPSFETCEESTCDVRLKTVITSRLKTVIISGATGLIGSELTQKLREQNISVKRLTRKVSKMIHIFKHMYIYICIYISSYIYFYKCILF